MAIAIPNLTSSVGMFIMLHCGSFPAFNQPILFFDENQLANLTEQDIDDLVMNFAVAVSAVYPGEPITAVRHWSSGASLDEEPTTVIAGTNPPE